jgi:hypothetical protein
MQPGDAVIPEARRAADDEGIARRQREHALDQFALRLQRQVSGQVKDAGHDLDLRHNDSRDFAGRKNSAEYFGPVRRYIPEDKATAVQRQLLFPRVLLVALSVAAANPPAHAATQAFDHQYRTYAGVLDESLTGSRVDYGRLASDRVALDAAVDELSAVQRETFDAWSRAQRLAYWINAYNVLTLRVIVDHYPIRGSWMSLYPRSSIRQIDGVWDDITWHAGGRQVTLDQIEHDILRPTFAEPLVHFAINCAALSCPPLRGEPFVAERLEAQLAGSTRQALALAGWLQLDGETLRLTAILDWFGEDFVPRFAGRIEADRSERDRALLGLVADFGPPAAAALARTGAPRIRFLDYDWTLNEVYGS